NAGPVRTGAAPDFVQSRHVLVADVRIPSLGGNAGGHPLPAVAGSHAYQTRAEFSHLLRNGSPHLLRPLAGFSALPRDTLGQRLPHRRSWPCHLAPSCAAGADGYHAARPHRLAVAVGNLNALDPGFDRLASGGDPRYRKILGRPTGLSRPARHVLGPA